MTRIVVAAAVACLWAGSVYAECSEADRTALQQLDQRMGIATPPTSSATRRS